MTEHKINSPGAMQAAPLFAASLTPNKPLSRRGFRWVIGLALVLAATPVMVFTSLGAWPIVGFMGLDVVALALALTLSMREARRHEEITLWPDRLRVRQISSRGKQTDTEFSPFHVRLLVDRDTNERTVRLRLRSREAERGGELEIGAFLAPEDKASFAKAFGTALRRARS